MSVLVVMSTTLFRRNVASAISSASPDQLSSALVRGEFPRSDSCHLWQGFVEYLFMKAYVTVMLKTTVLDPQGKTIHGALKKMGYKGVGAVRQGKFFELALDGGLDKAAAKAEVERIAKEVLTNPVIEEFSYRIEE
jgi:phosphoribosylformylglycinamidine synthase